MFSDVGPKISGPGKSLALGSLHAASDSAAPKAKADHQNKTERGSLRVNLERNEQVVKVQDKVRPCHGSAPHRTGENVAECLKVAPAKSPAPVT